MHASACAPALDSGFHATGLEFSEYSSWICLAEMTIEHWHMRGIARTTIRARVQRGQGRGRGQADDELLRVQARGHPERAAAAAWRNMCGVM